MKNENGIIFLLTNSLMSGGAEKQSVYLFNALRSKYKVLYIVYYGDRIDQRIYNLLPEDSLIDVMLLKGNHIRKISIIYRLFSASTNSICISYLATTNTINAIIGIISGIKIRIGGFRSSKFEYLKLIIQKNLHNYLLSHSVTNNYEGLSELVKFGFDSKKLSVIHNTIEIPKLLRIDHEIITIISVGRFVEAKDYFTAISAIKILCKLTTPFKYLIIGYGKLESSIRSYIEANKLSSVIELVINPSAVDRYYENADIFLSTSLYEGLSNSVMEAMSFGLPVIATNVGDNRYLIEEGETGFLTVVKDVETTASKLELLINDPSLRSTIGQKGRKHIMENFTKEKFAQEYIDLFEKLSNSA